MQHRTKLVVGNFGVSQLQVITDGAAHQRVALRHEAQLATDLHPTIRGNNETENQSEQCRLADARLTHDGGLRAGLEVVGKVRQYLPVARSIAERDIVEANGITWLLAFSFWLLANC